MTSFQRRVGYRHDMRLTIRLCSQVLLAELVSYYRLCRSKVRGSMLSLSSEARNTVSVVCDRLTAGDSLYVGPGTEERGIENLGVSGEFLTGTV